MKAIEKLPSEGGWEELMRWPRKKVGLDERRGEEVEETPGFGELMMGGDEMGGGSMAVAGFFGPSE